MNLNICNFPIFGLIFRKCSPKWRLETSVFIFLGKFGFLMFNWKKADICPLIGIENPCSDISVQMPRMTTAFAQRPLCTPAEVFLCCRRPKCAAMATIRRPQCAPLERATAFVLSMLKVRAVGRRSMRSNGVHWRCHCDAAEMLAIVLRAPWRSAFFLDAVGSR